MVLAEPSVITQHVVVFHEQEDLMEDNDICFTLANIGCLYSFLEI